MANNYRVILSHLLKNGSSVFDAGLITSKGEFVIGHGTNNLLSSLLAKKSSLTPEEHDTLRARAHALMDRLMNENMDLSESDKIREELESLWSRMRHRSQAKIDEMLHDQEVTSGSSVLARFAAKVLNAPTVARLRRDHAFADKFLAGNFKLVSSGEVDEFLREANITSKEILKDILDRVKGEADPLSAARKLVGIDSTAKKLVDADFKVFKLTGDGEVMHGGDWDERNGVEVGKYLFLLTDGSSGSSWKYKNRPVNLAAVQYGEIEYYVGNPPDSIEEKAAVAYFGLEPV